MASIGKRWVEGTGETLEAAVSSVLSEIGKELGQVTLTVIGLPTSGERAGQDSRGRVRADMDIDLERVRSAAPGEPSGPWITVLGQTLQEASERACRILGATLDDVEIRISRLAQSSRSDHWRPAEVLARPRPEGSEELEPTGSDRYSTIATALLSDAESEEVPVARDRRGRFTRRAESEVLMTTSGAGTGSSPREVGWYKDAVVGDKLHYWDGSSWSSGETRPDGAASTTEDSGRTPTSTGAHDHGQGLLTPRTRRPETPKKAEVDRTQDDLIERAARAEAEAAEAKAALSQARSEARQLAMLTGTDQGPPVTARRTAVVLAVALLASLAIAGFLNRELGKKTNDLRTIGRTTTTLFDSREQELLTYIPVGLRDTCDRAPSPAYTHVVNLHCRDASGVDFYYHRFDSEGLAREAFSGRNSGRVSGDCDPSKGSTFNYKASWVYTADPKNTKGMLGCWVDSDGMAIIEWTHDSLRIFTVARIPKGAEGDQRSMLWESWKNAGPIQPG